jgi:hypothetical protein
MESHVKHLFRQFDCFLNADQIFLVVILFHHFVLNLLALLLEHNATSLNILHDEYLLLVKGLDGILKQPQLQSANAILFLQDNALIVVCLYSVLHGLGLLFIQLCTLFEFLLQVRYVLLLFGVFPRDLRPIFGEFIGQLLLLIC